ncbi:MAG: nitronate monooxygenase [Mycobacterium sp.]|nr:nitronate monooxygenase [Mycobacterium sp.]
MAGGPSTPRLAAAVSEAGGLGFLAAGYRDADRVADDIARVRALSAGPVGVNIFVPQPCAATAGELDRYRRALIPLAERLGVEPGIPGPDDDGWRAKLDVVSDTRPEAVSFTFGCPQAEVLSRLRDRGILTMVTVTNRSEAAQATAAGAGALVAQGPEAGGHRSVFDPNRRPSEASLDALLAATAGAGVPVVAAGGIGDAAALARVLAGGAAAAQVGTALLLCDEAGTNPVHRAALSDDSFNTSIVTACFTGRYARSLANDFTAGYDAIAPLGYPHVHQITGPIRAAAVAAGDAQATSLWAGTAWRGIGGGPTARVIAAIGEGCR